MPEPTATTTPVQSEQTEPAKPRRASRKSATAKSDAVRKTSPRKTAVKKETEEPSLVPAPIESEVRAVQVANRGTYIEAVGRRKTSVARVRLQRGGKSASITVNGRPWEEYFPTEVLQLMVSSPLKAVGQWERHEITCKVSGGGTMGQAEAVRHGISRLMLELNPVFRKALKKSGYLTRDPRRRERKKPGLKGARRAPQFSKR
ncbi:30S ribosomal protein S9 [Candidatus Uhrbacteria bacterium]|nr:30S ribosomal protein S9 [Candidatus Uhrbacteria bacterium]